VRIGGQNDGAKWVCNPWHLKPKLCILYSIGVGYNLAFDLEIAKRFQCKIFAFDPDQFAPGQIKKWSVPNMEYKPWKIIGNQQSYQHRFLNRNEKSLDEVLRSMKHLRIDILKIDVEGAEFDILNDWLESVSFKMTKICHILLEMHGFEVVKWTNLLRRLEKTGFLMYSSEINLLAIGVKHDKFAVEYSFIHKNCFQEFGIQEPFVLYNFV